MARVVTVMAGVVLFCGMVSREGPLARVALEQCAQPPAVERVVVSAEGARRGAARDVEEDRADAHL